VAIDLKISAVPTRESRLGSITGYNGDLQDVINQSKCGSLKNKERCFSQSSSCNAMCALGQLSGIRDVAIINHAPSGVQQSHQVLM
jgi:nitrogenase molybdenum-iron protein alpha chain